MSSPYADRPERSYWRTGVFDRHPLNFGDIYIKKFDIRPNEQIATAGSCFAQHLAVRLRNFGYSVLDTEPAPPGLNTEIANNFGFGLYSARYGNIYNVRQLLQLVEESLGLRTPRVYVWKKGGRFFDALRPTVEPNGLASASMVEAHRRQHLARVRTLLAKIQLFVFTFGLTEAWVHVGDGTVYPSAPGVIAEADEPDAYGFKNFNYNEILDDFLQLRELLKKFNPNVRSLLTISPVPLTATAGEDHVLVATTYSKSVLRAVAGYLMMSYPDIEYFPSYELIASAPSRAIFYESNLRTVSPAGVDLVMKYFFDQHGRYGMNSEKGLSHHKGSSTDFEVKEANLIMAQRVRCEEELLERFAG